MKHRLDIRPEAEADIRNAARWYESERAGLGADFVEAVYMAIDSLADNALLHPIKFRHRHRQVRWMFPKRFPYRILYYLEGDAAISFAVFHAKRHDAAWKQRL